MPRYEFSSIEKRVTWCWTVLDFYLPRTSGFSSLTKFKAVSIPQEIGTPELEFGSRAWKRISKFSDSSFGNQTQFRVNQSRIRWPLVLVIFSSPPPKKKKRFSKIPILIPVPTESGSSTGSSFRPVLVPEPDPKIRFGSGLILILVLGFYEPKTSTTDSLTGWSRHLPNIAYAW